VSSAGTLINRIWRHHFYIIRTDLIFVSINMVNIVLDIKCIRLKYTLETINNNKVDPVI